MNAPLSLDEAHCLAVAWAAAKPRAHLTVSEWADAHRVLASKQSGEPGRWRTARNPLTREIMDCLSRESRVRDVVMMFSAQFAKTEIILNAIGYGMTEAPCPMMLMTPSIEATVGWKAQKLNPMLQETPIIRDMLGGQRARDAANRQDLVDFPGGILYLSGGNSPNSYAMKSVALLIMDDLDRFPAEVGNEGDPVLLAKQRTKAFRRAKRVFASTPTVKDSSLIYREWLDTDQRRAHVPCPHCGEYQPLEWGGPDVGHGIKWNADVTDAWYVCRDCGAHISEHHKPRMFAAHRWIPENPGNPRRGYHASTLYCSIGLGPTWLDLAQDWQVAVKSPSTLQAFINTNLGEPWEEKGVQVDGTGLMARLEAYEAPPVLAKTAGIDVQKDRLEITVDGWGDGEECWTLDHHILPGDTARPEVWGDLAVLLDDMAPDAVAIDSGYNTSMVYAFVASRRWAWAVKGIAGPGRPIVEDEKLRRQRLRRQKKKGITVHMVGDDQAKALLYSRLNLVEPGPGYIHFPSDPAFDDEYFQQLTAEKLVTKMRGTRPIVEWVQKRPRNEALDCKKYSLAALRLAGIDLAARARIAELKKKGETPPPPQGPRVRSLGRIGRLGR